MTMAPTIDYGVKRPLTHRVNFRLLAVVLVFSALVGLPVYKYIAIQRSHGIVNAGDHMDVDLKTMGNFKFNEFEGTLNDVPSDVRALNGKEVALEGWVYSPTSSGRVKNFEFVYNITKCCFNGPPKVQERVFASVKEENVEPVTGEEIRIFGKLHVSAKKDEVGKIEQVFTMDVDRTEPL